MNYAMFVLLFAVLGQQATKPCPRCVSRVSTIEAEYVPTAVRETIICYKDSEIHKWVCEKDGQRAILNFRMEGTVEKAPQPKSATVAQGATNPLAGMPVMKSQNTIAYHNVQQVAPFDVPPTEWRPRPNGTMTEHESGYQRYACADKSRFLLMSEDGRWHCLLLAGLQ